MSTLREQRAYFCYGERETSMMNFSYKLVSIILIFRNKLPEGRKNAQNPHF